MEKKSVGLLELETAVLKCFLEKTPLSPLGVNNSAMKSSFVLVFNAYIQLEFYPSFLSALFP
jgi:hypothetical protein